MKINAGTLIKKIRGDLGLNQEEMADRLFINSRQLSRIETGEAKFDIWQLMSTLETLGYPSEDFWLVYLDSDDYDGYRIYRELRAALRDDDAKKASELLGSLQQNSVSEKPIVRQIIAWVEIKLNNDLSHEDELEELYKVLRMSKKNFEESKISEYKLNYTEIRILMAIAACCVYLEDKERAINIFESLVKSREKSRTSEEDRAIFFPVLLFNLSNLYGQAERVKESLKACEQGLAISKEYNNFRFVPRLLHNMASGLRLSGEEEQIYKPLLVRAYHCAYAMGQMGIAKTIKKEAKEKFGILEL
jgi:transcriptional regulator with XRE-family HTH domain